jgi:phosphoenolpyruvate carboxylase
VAVSSSNPIPTGSSVNLPTTRRGTVVAAARAGARSSEDLAEFIAQRARKDRAVPAPVGKHVGGKKDGVPTVTIPRTEHALLIDIALVAQEFMPLLEMSGAPVKRPREWEMLSEGLEDFRRVRSGNNQAAAAKHAALGLMNIERLLADE